MGTEAPSELSPESQARAERRRATWTATLGTEQRAPQAADSTPEQRVGVMQELALAGWALTGQALPEYSRATMPGRVIRPTEGGG